MDQCRHVSKRTVNIAYMLANYKAVLSGLWLCARMKKSQIDIRFRMVLFSGEQLFL